MHMDPVMPYLVGGVAAVLLLGLLLRALNQPHVVAYLIAGVVLGPGGLELVTDQATIARLGELGVVLLLFFVGMEISLPDLVSRWKVPVIGTLLQIAISVGCVAAVGAWQGWPAGRSMLLGFVVALSSTAVVIKVLQAQDELSQPVGRDVVGVLLVQDLAIVPMLIAVGAVGGQAPSPLTVALQCAGGALTIGVIAYLAARPNLELPLERWLGADPELRVFGGGLLCFGLALATGMLGLSAALGAFMAGIIVGASRQTHWVHESMFPFHVLFLALFFVSVGMLIDLDFVWQNAGLIAVLVVAVLVTNTLVNLLILRVLGRTWGNSLYGGALLAQIGEFSFVLAAIGRQADLIEEFGYQATIAIIALTMLVSPAWIAGARLLGRLTAARTPPPRRR